MHQSRLTITIAILTVALGSCHGRGSGGGQPGSADRAAAIRLNNLGVAYMSQARVAAGLESFRQALAKDSSLFAARLNEGIALLNNQRFEEARQVLLDVTQQQPANARAWYNLGIAYRTLAQADPAIQAFEQVARIDPADPDTYYFLGQLQTDARRYDQAIRAYERAIALDSLHVSAEFGLARAYQLSGNEEAARRHLNRFDQLTQSKVGKPISLVYGEQGPYSTAEPVGDAPAASPEFVVSFRGVDAGTSGLRFDVRRTPDRIDRVLPLLGPAACFIDFDKDGKPDLLLPGGAKTGTLLRNSGGGRFIDVTASAGFMALDESLGCAVGDYDNDGWDDVVIGLPNRVAVYRNFRNGTFADVTSQLGIQFSGLPSGLTLLDYDHDGDLDLYIAKFFDYALQVVGQFNAFTEGDIYVPPNDLFRNNGNGTFTNSTNEFAMGRGPSVGAMGTDLNNDRAIDFVLTTGLRRPPEVLTNTREGPFRGSEPWSSPVPAMPAGVVAFDFNKDGWMDLAFTHWDRPGLSVWKNANGTRFDRVTIPEPQWSRAWGIAVIDADNDGWLDLTAVGEDGSGRSEIRLLRNMGGDQFSDVTAQSALFSVKLERPRALVVGDVDGDGDNDLVVTQNGGQPQFLKNEGGNRRNSVRLAFQGLADNRGGIGTKVEVFAGALRQKFELPSSSGYMGQNAPGIIAGIDRAREADIVRLLWPTGVIQDEVQLASGNRRHLVGEIDRRGSSCPVLFVWNGKEYEFIADMIGPGIVGHWEAPGRRNISDPTEYLRVEGSRVKAKNGRLSFRFAEVMEEVTYLDQVRLLAVDHPSDIAAYPNEYFASVPPFPEFKIITSRNARPPRAAVDNRGRNVLPELMKIDRRYVAGFESLSYPGYTKLHYVDLDLGDVDVSGSLRLIMQGYIEYFTATSVFAAHQGGVEAVVPFLDVQTASGEWKRAIDDIGFPAGLARSTVADLTGKLPAGTKRIRIGTNLKIFWDQILFDTTPQTSRVEIHEVPVAEASFRFLGYPRQIEGNPPSDLSYLYNRVSATGPFARHSGYYTAYGNVLPLLTGADDRFVILGSGDEVALEFDATALPPLQPGWSRDYLFYADGFAKDMDFYEALSDTVEPLPFHSMGQYPYGPDVRYPASRPYMEYRLGANTRYLSETGGIPAFRFQY